MPNVFGTNNTIVHRCINYDNFERWLSFDGILFHEPLSMDPSADRSDWKPIFAPVSGCGARIEAGLLRVIGGGSRYIIILQRGARTEYVLDTEFFGNDLYIPFAYTASNNYWAIEYDSVGGQILLKKILPGATTTEEDEDLVLKDSAWHRVAISHDGTAGTVEVFLDGKLILDVTDAGLIKADCFAGLGTLSDETKYRHFAIYTMNDIYVDWAPMNVVSASPRRDIHASTVSIAGRHGQIPQYGGSTGDRWEIQAMTLMDTGNVVAGSDFTRAVYDQVVSAPYTLRDFLLTNMAQPLWFNFPMEGFTPNGILLGPLRLPDPAPRTKGRTENYGFTIQSVLLNGVDD